MAKQENQTKTFSVVVSKTTTEETTKTYDSVLKVLKELGLNECHSIRHDKDTKEDGSAKLVHYHLAVKLESRSRSTALLKYFDKQGIDTTGIQIDSCKNWISLCQYLIHKNDVDKYQYLPSDVESIGKDYDFYLKTLSDGDLTEEDFISAIKHCSNSKGVINPYEMVKTIGLSNLRKNLSIIRWFEDYNKNQAPTMESPYKETAFEIIEDTGEILA